MAKIFNKRLDFLSVLHFAFLEQFQVQVLDFVLLHPDNFPVVETHHWELFPNLNDNRCFVKAKGHVVGLWQSMDSPDSLQAVVQSCF